MLTSMYLFNNQGDLVSTFPIYNPSPDNAYLVKEIQGLGPPPASIITSDYAFQDGAGYVSSRTEKRNIVIQVGYRPRPHLGESVQSLRRILYKMLRLKSRVRIRIESDSAPTVEIDAYVETHEPTIFSAEPSVQISLLCLQPYFKDAVTRSEIMPRFSSKMTSDVVTLRNEGDIPVGVEYEIAFEPNAPDTPDDLQLTMEHQLPNGEINQTVLLNTRIKEITGGNIRKYDRIIFRSISGSRAVELHRDINVFNILGAINNGMDAIHWATLDEFGGDNKFRYYMTNQAVFDKTVGTIRYVPMYEGI